MHASFLVSTRDTMLVPICFYSSCLSQCGKWILWRLDNGPANNVNSAARIEETGQDSLEKKNMNTFENLDNNVSFRTIGLTLLITFLTNLYSLCDIAAF